ncbi:hypothetical protein ACFW1A_09190 [Kitasatospora sp. NPDC058965]|uniref:hypothetical protein n=1 Tax=Kitasatospora sp. NPDC058965 TaxID=3346682 RepID=UPI0036BBA50C
MIYQESSRKSEAVSVMNVPAEVSVVGAMARVGGIFTRIAADLRKLPGVREVSHPCWMAELNGVHAEDSFDGGHGDGFQIEWYAEAEFSDGRAISFNQILTWCDGEWTVQAAIHSQDYDGQHELLVLPDRCAIGPEDLADELTSQSRLLADSQPEGVRLFFA